MHSSRRKRFFRSVRGKLRSWALARHGIGIVTETRHGTLVVDPRDFGVSRFLLADGSYDWDVICWLLRLLDARSRLVFVGAHLGALLVPIALRSGSRDIVAFEPSPRNYRLLTLNLALNGLGCVKAHQLAIGDCEGPVRFTENPQNSGNSRISTRGEVQARMTTLDAALSEDRRPVDLMVIDMEGSEVRALRAGPQCLAGTRYLYVEFAPEQLAEQGSKPREFIELMAARYPAMYLPGPQVTFFSARSYVRYLRDLPERRGLLRNLLFCDDSTPDPRLMGSEGLRAPSAAGQPGPELSCGPELPLRGARAK